MSESTTRTSAGCAPTRSALPGRMVDLIRDGVSPRDLKESGGRAAWSALVRTAASAQQRGWVDADWTAFVLEAPSKLGQQLRVKRGRERPERNVRRDLAGAWDAAERWLATRPPADEFGKILAEQVEATRQLADASVLDPAQSAVLALAAKTAESNHTTTPALPRQATADITGLTPKKVRMALDRLTEAGVLTLARRGKRQRRDESGAQPHARPRANLYRLPAPDLVATYLCRVPRPMGPSPETYGPSLPTAGWPSGETYGPFEGQVRHGWVTQPKAPPDASKAMRRFDGTTYPVEVRVRPNGGVSFKVRNCGPLLAAAQVAAQKARSDQAAETDLWCGPREREHHHETPTSERSLDGPPPCVDCDGEVVRGRCADCNRVAVDPRLLDHLDEAERARAEIRLRGGVPPDDATADYRRDALAGAAGSAFREVA